jgi:homocysteine S-methyltransferase
VYGPDIVLDKLKDFHRRRLQVLVNAGPDLLAFEAIPNKLEAQVSRSVSLPLSVLKPWQ